MTTAMTMGWSHDRESKGTRGPELSVERGCGLEPGLIEDNRAKTIVEPFHRIAPLSC